mgnify:CR=1 FL=1
MHWEDLLKRTPPKSVRIEPGERPAVRMGPVDPPGFGPTSSSGKVSKPADQPIKVQLKEQVMGAAR